MSRVKVATLHRIGPPANQGYSYYSPDGHCIGPFSTEEERELDLQTYYDEVIDDKCYGLILDKF